MKIAPVLILILLAGCAPNSAEAEADVRPGNPIYNSYDYSICPELYDQISNYPERDAKQRVAKGDRRYIAGMHPGFHVPGLPEEMVIAMLESGRGYRYLEGQEDGLKEESCMHFHYDAPEYVERYNKEILGTENR